MLIPKRSSCRLLSTLVLGNGPKSASVAQAESVAKYLRSVGHMSGRSEDSGSSSSGFHDEKGKLITSINIHTGGQVEWFNWRRDTTLQNQTAAMDWFRKVATTQR